MLELKQDFLLSLHTFALVILENVVFADLLNCPEFISIWLGFFLPLFIFRDQWKFTLHHAVLLVGAFLSRKIYLAVTALPNVFDQLVIVYGPVKDTWLSYCRFKILLLGEVYRFRWCVIFHDFIYNDELPLE